MRIEFQDISYMKTAILREKLILYLEVQSHILKTVNYMQLTETKKSTLIILLHQHMRNKNMDMYLKAVNSQATALTKLSA